METSGLSEFVAEAYEAGRMALERGLVRAAALLACAGLEAAGMEVERASKLRDAVLAGISPSPEDVEELLGELGRRVGESEVVVEVDVTAMALAGLGVALLALVFLSLFPPWADSLLIPCAAALFLMAFLRR